MMRCHFRKHLQKAYNALQVDANTLPLCDSAAEHSMQTKTKDR